MKNIEDRNYNDDQIVKSKNSRLNTKKLLAALKDRFVDVDLAIENTPREVAEFILAFDGIN